MEFEVKSASLGAKKVMQFTSWFLIRSEVHHSNFGLAISMVPQSSFELEGDFNA